jgi:cell division septum initiation protein DivIVA
MMPLYRIAGRSAPLLVLLLATAAQAQMRAPLPPAPPLPPDLSELAALAPMPAQSWGGMPMFFSTTAADRGYLGITPHYVSGPADTIGILVQDVEEGFGADKAGIKRGDRLVSIDGVDLRVDPRDLGDYEAEVLPERRLRRVLEQKEPGETVSVVVWTDGRRNTRQLVLSESPAARTMSALRTTTSVGRRVLGVGFSQRGSMRDTAGLLITSITSGGAADKAGLSEGDRIVSIDGVDLRVPEADAGSSDGVEARVARLRRTLDALKDSQSVRLDVLSDGRRRTVSVVPTRERGFTIASGNLRDMTDEIRASVRANLGQSQARSEMSRERAELLRDRAEEVRERAQAEREFAREQAREQAQIQRDMAREQAQQQREMARVERDAVRARASEERGSWSENADSRSDVRGRISGRTDGATMTLSGLSLAAVDLDFAQQFGRGSENGALVVRTGRVWEPIRTGDVILSVEGRSVRDGNSLDITFDRRRDQQIEILRNGRKETITLPATR